MKNLALGEITNGLANFREKKSSQLWVFEDVLGRGAKSNDQAAIRGDKSFIVHC